MSATTGSLAVRSCLVCRWYPATGQASLIASARDPTPGDHRRRLGAVDDCRRRRENGQVAIEGDLAHDPTADQRRVKCALRCKHEGPGELVHLVGAEHRNDARVAVAVVSRSELNAEVAAVEHEYARRLLPHRPADLPGSGPGPHGDEPVRPRQPILQ